MAPEYDIIIAGGGMVGASLACALGNTALHCCVIEPAQLTARSDSTYDDRGIALSQSSRHILKQLDIWQKLAVMRCPIKEIHISEQGHFGTVRLRANDAQLAALGYVVMAHGLGAALYQGLDALDNIELLQPAKLIDFSIAPNRVTVQLTQTGYGSRTITGKLLVAADGCHSAIRTAVGIACDTKDYQQTAIVTNITTKKQNNYTAFERFTGQGSIASLPIDRHRSVCVLVTPAEQAAALSKKDDAAFIQHIQSHFKQLGKIEKITARNSYPIQYSAAKTQYQQNMVLLGSAALSMHPNTAQGFNLGLRDAVCLATILKQNQQAGLNDINMLRQYYQQRKADQQRVVCFSQLLTSLFYSASLPKRLLRHQIMRLLAYQPHARSKLIHFLTGLSATQSSADYDPDNMMRA